MKKKWLKKSSAVLIAAAMILSVFPGTKGTMSTVYAADNAAPTADYWIEANSLKTGYNLKDGTLGKIKFGANDRLWAVCGVDGDDLALLSTTEFQETTYGNDSKYSTSDFVNNISTYLGSTYFTSAELNKMQEVSVKTLEWDQSGTRADNGSTVTSKLYLPDAQTRESYRETSIYVGANNDIEIELTKLTSGNGFGKKFFWLRSPYIDVYDESNYVLGAFPGGRVDNDMAVMDQSVVPALNLNLSSAIFASAAEAASSSYSGDKANSTMAANTYTMRYAPADSDWNNISAEISTAGTSVKVANAIGKYLVVQNSKGVNALSIDSANTTINASSVTIASETLSDFNNCKVWVESTTDRITTAKLATKEIATKDIASVEITDIEKPIAGKSLDVAAACATAGVSEATPVVTWTPNDTNAGYNTAYTANVTLTATKGYQFTDATTAKANGNTATKVTKNEDGTLAVFYTFPATAKDKLTSITTPTGLTVANGTAYSAMNLPSEVAIVTEGNTVTTAPVAWNTTTPASGSYNSSILTKQTVTLNGTVTCPTDIDQNSVDLSTTITITINEAGIVGAPSFDPVGATYTENKTVALTSTTDGATIYYTMDGSTPNTGSSVYKASIQVTGVAGEKNATTIKAIAVKDGMQTSSVASAIYVIEIPAPGTDPTPSPGATYAITGGAAGTHQLGTAGTLTITCSGALDKLNGIYVDSKLMAATNYTLKAGSTILTLKDSYLNTLGTGTHTLRFQYNDGYADTTFIISAAATDNLESTTLSQKDRIPKTGDGTPIAWLLILAMISGGTLVFFRRK